MDADAAVVQKDRTGVSTEPLPPIAPTVASVAAGELPAALAPATECAQGNGISSEAHAPPSTILTTASSTLPALPVVAPFGGNAAAAVAAPHRGRRLVALDIDGDDDGGLLDSRMASPINSKGVSPAASSRWEGRSQPLSPSSGVEVPPMSLDRVLSSATAADTIESTASDAKVAFESAAAPACLQCGTPCSHCTADAAAAAAGGDAVLGPPPQALMIKLSEKAALQEQLASMMPHREFCFDENGKVIVDGHEDYRSHGYSDYMVSDFQNMSECVEAFQETQQLRIQLALIRTEINEKAILVSAHHTREAWGTVEPPSTPNRDRRRNQSQHKRESLSSAGANFARFEGQADERYRDLCCDLGLPASRLACRALHCIESGGEKLPKEFAGKGYLGNRCAQALFMCLLGSLEAREGKSDSTLNNLKNLDLSGQGLGNEAAVALSQLLPRCPQLADLNLSRNSISEKGAQCLLKEVSQHPALLNVSLEANPTPSWIRVSIKEEMQKRQDNFERKRKRERLLGSPPPPP